MSAAAESTSTSYSSPAPKQGRLLRRVLKTDPSQEYLLYVPSSRGSAPPLLVSVHGVSRNADEHAKLLSAYCEMFGVVLVVPHFSIEQHPDYQRLGRIGRGKRADVALNSIIAEASETTGASAARFYLFGFSGGAQFAHRYLMAHPHRIANAVIASAGWYTLPDATMRFPYGCRPSKKLPGVHFDAEEFLQVPITVMVGANDDRTEGLRRSARIDRTQGTNRVERARRFVAEMESAAAAHHMKSMVSYREIEKCDHSFRRSILRNGLGDLVFDTMFGTALATLQDEVG